MSDARYCMKCRRLNDQRIIDDYEQMRNSGASLREIAKKHFVSVSAVSIALKRRMKRVLN